MPSPPSGGPGDRPAGRTAAERQVAFYKLLKFWLVFLLAVCLAAALWRALAGGGAGASQGAAFGDSYIR